MHGTFSNTRSGNGTPFSPSREATLYCAADIEAQCEGRQTPMGANLETEASGQEENDGAGDVGGHESIQTRNDRTPKHVAVGQHQAGKNCHAVHNTLYQILGAPVACISRKVHKNFQHF